MLDMELQPENANEDTPRPIICISSWWFEPIWKILVKMGIFPK